MEWLLLIVGVALTIGLLAARSKSKPVTGFMSTETRNANNARMQHVRHALYAPIDADPDEIERSVEDFHKNRIRWSGRVEGPLPVKRLTVLQSSCLLDAVGRRRIVPSDFRNLSGAVPPTVALHPTQTVESLVRHGFLVEDPRGGYVCTDLGARAYETL